MQEMLIINFHAVLMDDLGAFQNNNSKISFYTHLALYIIYVCSPVIYYYYIIYNPGQKSLAHLV